MLQLASMSHTERLKKLSIQTNSRIRRIKVDAPISSKHFIWIRNLAWGCMEL